MTSTSHTPSALRVLMPYRLDFFARSMDTTLATMWLALRDCCDMVFWGPGFPGFDPTRTLDDVAREVAPDVVLLPDLHHAQPGLWDELLAGVEHVSAPKVVFLSDPSSALEQRMAYVERVRPAAVLGLGPASSYAAYDDLLARLDAELLLRPLGHDPDLFFVDAPDAERDIDVLICGATGGDAYPVRTRIKQAAAQLADEWHVVDMGHPGYWECIAAAPTRRGQTSFADMLRRAKVVVTGTTYEILSAKYYEVAACGAVGVGDLPPQVGADDLRGAMLEVAPSDEVSTIAAAMRSLLADPRRLDELRERAHAAARVTDITARAAFTVELLEGLLERRGLTRIHHEPRAPQRIDDTLRACIRVDAAAPTGRRDWHDVAGAPADLAAELTPLLRQSAHDICVLAFDPDAATTAEAQLLAELARSSGGIAIRHAAAGTTPLDRGFCCVAVDRAALLDELPHHDGAAAIEAAVWRLLDSRPVVALSPPGFDTPAARARRSVGALDAGNRAAAEPRDPQLGQRRIPGARLARLDPTDTRAMEHVVELMQDGFAAAPLELVVPLRSGATLDSAVGTLQSILDARGIDIDACCDVIVLERPCSDAELSWLAA